MSRTINHHFWVDRLLRTGHLRTAYEEKKPEHCASKEEGGHHYNGVVLMHFTFFSYNNYILVM